MRRSTVILCLLVLLLPGSALAGLLPAYGVKAGLNFSNVDLDDLESSNRTGMVGGLFLHLPLTGLNLQGEILYSTKGFKEGTLSDQDQFDFRVHDLQIPVLAKVTLPVPAITPSLYAGPALSFRVKGEMQDSAGDWVDVKDDLKSLLS